MCPFLVSLKQIREGQEDQQLYLSERQNQIKTKIKSERRRVEKSYAALGMGQKLTKQHQQELADKMSMSMSHVRLTNEEKAECVKLLMKRQLISRMNNSELRLCHDQEIRLAPDYNNFRFSYSNPTNMEGAWEKQAGDRESAGDLLSNVAQSICGQLIESVVEQCARRAVNRQKREKKKINNKFFKSLLTGTFCSSKFQRGIRVIG